MLVRYFCNGTRVARVLTDASFGSAQFFEAAAQLYSVKREDFVDRPRLAYELVYTGDWVPCTEAEALDLIDVRMKRVAELS